MIKKIFVIFFVSLFCYNLKAEYIVGNVHFKSKKYKDLNVIGEARFEDVQSDVIVITGPFQFANLRATELIVTGPVAASEKGKFDKVVITGELILSDSIMNVLSVTGSCELNSVKVINQARVTGFFIAENSIFDNLCISGKKVVLNNSRASNLLIKKEPSLNQPQKLIVKGKTYIKEVVFESGQGEIHIYGKAVVIDNVTGAKITCH
ncbi:MAG: hypothetical protein H6492_02955 [Candidatus Paracaedibacteraceae bacterium]|nr:hypothetical protein [Candidatus Paracaedibacteraceae bacterium]